MKLQSTFISLLTLVFCLALAARTDAAEDAGPLGIRVQDLNGKVHHLGDDPTLKGTVFVFLSGECPICNHYSFELNRLAGVCKEKNVELFGVVSDPFITRKSAAEHQKKFDLKFPLLFDANGQLARLLEPTHVPEAFLISPAGKTVYRGRIDDSFVDVRKQRAQPTKRDLSEAVDALASGRPIVTATTTPVGCKLQLGSTSKSAEPLTFARHIAPILYANCTECHRDGEVAPFPLVQYSDAAKRADWLAEIVERRVMPPWKAEEGHGRFLAERRLSDADRATIVAWAKTGATKGDDADMPSPPKYPSGWQLGEPDLVLEAPHEVSLPGDGRDVFHHFVLPFHFPNGQEVSAVEFRPGNPSIVHHAIIVMDDSGVARRRDASTPEPGYATTGGLGIPLAGILTIWAPGVTPRRLPADVALSMPPTGDIVVQLHLHPSGKPEKDRSRVGLHFAKTPASRHVLRRPFIFGPVALDIPPGAKAHRVESTMTLPVDLTLTALLPHMHLIGREMKVTAKLPDGTQQNLVWIKDWNFNWQDQYVYREPVRLPMGTVVQLTGVYDNSSENPANPRTPPTRVMFGEGTDDEMCLAIFQVVADDPQAAAKLRNSVMRNVLAQIQNPSVPADVRSHLFGKVRELAGPELGAALRSRLLGSTRQQD